MHFLKILQVGAIDGEQVIVLLQEFHLDNSSLLDMVNSLVASGEVNILHLHFIMNKT